MRALLITIIVTLQIYAPTTLMAQSLGAAHIKVIFSRNGCNVTKVNMVAETDTKNEKIYVAWCASLYNYLAVLKCVQSRCRYFK